MTDTTAVWNRIAGFWDDHLGEGNAFQKQLIMPTTDRLLGDVAGRRILDACCGNGNYSRRLAGRGAMVTAFDGAAVFIDRAKTRGADGIDYRVIDATDAAALATLGDGGSFDAVVCSMAMMDLPDLGPLLTAAHRLLKPGWRVRLFGLPPCVQFHRRQNDRRAGVRERPRSAALRRGHHDVSHAGAPTPAKACSTSPSRTQCSTARLALLLRDCFTAGFVVDALEEPAFPAGHVRPQRLQLGETARDSARARRAIGQALSRR